jgi:glycosyltransferase involved in cell wall biosynthesis
VTQGPRIVHVAAVEYTARALLAPQMAMLEERGYDVRLVCAPDHARFAADLERFRPVEVDFPRSIRPAAMARALRQFRAVVSELEPDVVHLHTPAVAMTVRLMPRRALPDRTRLLYTVHGFAHVWDRPSLRNTALERVERVLARRTDALLFQSQEDLDEVGRRHYRTETFYLGNGVQEDWFTGPRRGQDRVGRRGLFVGRLVREKGILDLLDAMELAPDVSVGVAGPELPTERDGVGRVVRTRAAVPPLAGRVELMGMLDRQEMRAAHGRTDFLVLPSYREGVPRSIIEGMASGLPAVVTDVRGCREVVRHGHNGFVVPPGEPAALARALQAMADLSDPEYRAMSQAAYTTVSESFRESAVYDRLVQIYSAVGAPPPSLPVTAAGGA